MSTQSNIQLIQNLYAAFGRGDVPAILEHLADDVTWGIASKSNVARSIPWHETLHGKASVPRFFEALAATADFTRFEPQAFAASDDCVYCTVRWEATYKPTGRKLTEVVLHRFTFKNGRITEWLGTEDTALTAEAARAT